MSKEELKKIKKKVVFWFWANNIFLAIAYFFTSAKDTAPIAGLFYPFIWFSVFMMFLRLSQWFIEREN